MAREDLTILLLTVGALRILDWQELISNRKEVTEDEHAGGDELTPGDFFNRERMDPRKGWVGMCCSVDWQVL